MADEMGRINGGYDYPDDEQLDRVLAEIDEIKRTIRSLPDGDRILAGGTTPTGGYGETYRPEPSVVSDPELRAAVDRLVRSIDELRRASGESDKRFSDEINLIKNQIYKLSGKEDVSVALNKIGGNVKRAEEFMININNVVESLSSAERASGKETDTELLRQLYEIKTLVGAPSAAAEKRNEGLSELYNLLAKVRYETSRNSASTSDKFSAVDALRQRLEETDETDVAPIVTELNSIIDKLVASPLDLNNFDDVLAYARTSDAFSVAPSRKESVRSYLTSVSALLSGGAVNGIDDLPDLIAAKNNIQSNRNEFRCESIYSSVLNANIAILSEKDETKLKSLRADLAENVRKLTVLDVCDLIDYPHVELRRGFRPVRPANTDGLFDRLTEIKNMLLDANLAPADKIITADGEESGKVDAESVSRAILDLKGDCLAILDKLGDKEAEEENSAVPTIGEIVVQLDRLFEDVKNLVTDSENTVMGSIEVLGDAVASLSATTEERAQASKDDRIKILEGIDLLTGGKVGASTSSESHITEFEARLKDAERRQRALMNAVEANALESAKRAEENKAAIIAAFDAKADEIMRAFDSRLVSVLQAVEHTATLASAAFVAPEPDTAQGGANTDAVLAEIKKLREQLFAISMANVSENDKARYESYNSLILNEIYDLADSVSEIRDELGDGTNAEITAKITEGIAAIEKKLNVAIDGNAEHDAIVSELSKLKEEIEKTPARKIPQKTTSAKTTLPRKTVPASVRRKNAPKPLTGNLSVDEILSRIGETRVVTDDEE